MRNGKGDAQRPRKVSRRTYEDNWEMAFNKGRKKPLAPDAALSETSNRNEQFKLSARR